MSRFHFLNNLVRQFTKDNIPQKMIVLNELQNNWERIAGKNIAFHSFPNSIQNGIILTHVDDPSWIQEYTLMKDDFLVNIHQFLKKRGGDSQIRGIKFINGKIEQSHAIPENNKGYVEPQDLENIAKTIKNIKDEKLKEALKDYFIKIKTKFK